MSKRIQIIDELARRDHFYLTDEDECFYYGEYTARKGHSFSETNQLILNLKKKMDRKNLPEWVHKTRAIATVSRVFKRGLKQDFLASSIIVPMPPSKIKTDPAYDDRMLQIARGMGEELDVREILSFRNNMVASHDATDRPNPTTLYNAMHVNESLCGKPRKSIVIIDDVLTAGSHFKAAKRHLAEHFPDARILGLFVARRILNTDELNFEDLL